MSRRARLDPQALEEFQDTLNRSLNKTVTQARLTTVYIDAQTAAVGSFEQGGGPVRLLGALPLGNGHFLSVLIRVRTAETGVTTERTSIAYRVSADMAREDWIIRYEYENAMAETGEYPYPVAHLHVNATPANYRGSKAFPDLHLPTRRLSLEEILTHLIREHGVPTLGEQVDALAFLEEQRREFERRRTDPGRLANPDLTQPTTTAAARVPKKRSRNRR